ncbi:MAG TPA: Smr/MutS family protein [Verrucomicrobiota bacterium]|nr:DNA mismatch repair protein MutS [Verrucomicrobiales bacterium]HRI15300.1 Smr/MutS family protein [Verrucomicrobiota bacterium]
MTDLSTQCSDVPPVDLPITGELDLHTFRPREIGSLVPEYLRLCRERGILEVRVIHGKGTGQLWRTVQALVARLPEVASFDLASPAYGGDGATWVRLHPLESAEHSKVTAR